MAENPQVARGGPAPVEYDGYADGQAIDPGMLLEVSSVDGEQGFSPHSISGGYSGILVALTEPYFGDRKDSTHPLNDSYAAGEHVRAGVFQRGALVGLRLPATTALTEGTVVASDGAGNIRAWEADGTAPDDEIGSALGEIHGGDFDSGAGDILATVRVY